MDGYAAAQVCVWSFRTICWVGQWTHDGHIQSQWLPSSQDTRKSLSGRFPSDRLRPFFWPTSTKRQAWILRKSNNGCNGCSFGRHSVLKRDRIPLLKSYSRYADSGCVAWPTNWMSKLNLKLSAYTQVYTVLSDRRDNDTISRLQS